MCYFDGMSRRNFTELLSLCLVNLEMTSKLYLCYSGNGNMRSSLFFDTTFTRKKKKQETRKQENRPNLLIHIHIHNNNAYILSYDYVGGYLHLHIQHIQHILHIPHIPIYPMPFLSPSLLSHLTSFLTTTTPPSH